MEIISVIHTMSICSDHVSSVLDADLNVHQWAQFSKHNLLLTESN